MVIASPLVHWLFPVDTDARGADIEANDESHFPFAANGAGLLRLRANWNSTMRISGGGARGIPLIVPRGDAVRPATDGMRQAVFSSLGSRVVGVRFLDLFAGSGAYGLEALSRGAIGGVFVEKNAKAVASLRRNLEAVCRSLGRGLQDLEILQADASKSINRGSDLPELIFIDPPYEIIVEISGPLFARLGESNPARGERLVVFEMPGEVELNPPGWVCVKRLGKGVRQPTVAFFRQALSHAE